MSDFCHHGNYRSSCSVCKIEAETPVGDWYLYVYATLYERKENIEVPEPLMEIRCGYVKDAQRLVNAYNTAMVKVRKLEGKK